MFSMGEIIITIGGWDYEKKLNMVRRIYELVLAKDENWHFFNEYDKVVIRYTKEFYEKLYISMKTIANEFTENTHIEYSFADYEENVEATQKYLGSFIQIFHGFSMLAINIKHEEDLAGVTDRVLHCWLNMATCDNFLNRFLASMPEGNLSHNSEAIVGHLTSTMRSFTSGYFLGNSQPRIQNKYTPEDE